VPRQRRIGAAAASRKEDDADDGSATAVDAASGRLAAINRLRIAEGIFMAQSPVIEREA